MLAFGYKQASQELNNNSIQSANIPKPVPAGRDLLIKVEAISVNPVDTKIRRTVNPTANEFKILGWDAVGTVVQTGSACELFKVGDEVFYAGDVSKPGSNAEYQRVDERIVGFAPKNVSHSEAAAMPLTSITAYELLFDRLQVPQNDAGKGKTLLVVGAAGGVGSVLVQLAKQLTSLKVVATASRQETKEWVTTMGADVVVDHSQPLDKALKDAGIENVDFVASLTHTDKHFEAVVSMMTAQSRFGLIDDPSTLDISLLKRKSISLHWEFMYTRPLFNTADLQRQHDVLNLISEMLDKGTLRSTMTKNLGKVTAVNLIEAHTILESGSMIGKLVLEGFSLDRSES